MALSTPLRRSVDTVVASAHKDLAALWRQVTTAAEAQVALNDLLPTLIEHYGLAAATLAAEWYDDLRSKDGITGSFTAEPADLGHSGAYALAGWALSQQMLYGGDQGDSSLLVARARVAGGTQRRIVNFARATVMGATVADPQADGWQRQTDGDACAFCEMLAGRAKVYTSESSAAFASHDDCGCSAVPAWGGLPVPVKPYTPSLRKLDWTPERRAKENARVRDWLRTHPSA